ncbi:uncharacterized protein LOC115254181 [Aedes albopictus]|uniref:Nanos-type domain-containing protein n=1 Tax=Aedes albopictus TaxID=7160 RepID=A0ABM1XPJ6_AEDAL
MIPTSPRPKSTNKMENIKPYFYLGSAATSFSSSSGAESCESDPAFLFYGSPDSGVNDLSATFQELTIDVDGMVQELFERNKRDTDSIRQDFIRNGIDSSIAECVPTRRLPPPGFGALSKWPLSACENNSSTAGTNLKDNKMDEPERKANKSTYQSNRRKRSKENEDYCVFCYNNREKQEIYLDHCCRDEEGYVICPKLRKYVCPYCQATGQLAHTKKYCPKKPIITPDDLKSMVLPFDGQPATAGRGRGKKSLRF